MRLFRTLPALALLAGARASSLDGRAPEPHPLDARALIDVCASVDADLEIPGLLDIPILVGKLDICLCLSAIPTFLQTNALAIVAVAIAGNEVVTAIITALINEAAPKSRCTYPPNAAPACISGNPCGFTCPNGFTPSPPSHPTTCVCSPPHTICNGVCGTFKGCGTSKPYAKREKRWMGSGFCSERGEGWMACGVFGGGARAWECLDTANDLESCGGCALPLTPYTPLGTDCTALPGVADVSCLSGSCLVRRCLPGYTLAKDSSHCIHGRTASVSSPFDLGAKGNKNLPASEYGLEHVPLKH